MSTFEIICKLCKTIQDEDQIINRCGKDIVLKICKDCYDTKTKKCYVCEEEKSYTDMTVHNYYKDGFESVCKKCKSLKNKERLRKYGIKTDYHKNKEYYDKYRKEYYHKKKNN